MSSNATSQPPPLTLAAPPSSSKTSLAPGFRFHPTDEELVSYYLKRKIANRPFRVDAISELDLYKSEPWDLPGKSRIRSRDMEWYFFSPLDRKYANRSRTSRTTGVGYWKTTGKDRAVKRGARTVGMKKTLVFHVGKAPKGTRTNWVMHEYRLGDDSEAGRSQEPEYVVCRIFQKNGAGPQNGAQYGAPFVEEEWEEEDNSGLVAMKEDGEDESRIDFGDELFMPSDDFEDENKAVDIQKEDADPLLGSNDGSIIDRTTVGSANLNSDGNNSKDSESSAEMSELDNNNDSNGFSDVQLPEILQNQGLPQDDYLELNDFTDFFDVELFSGEDLAVCKEESNSIQGSTGQLSELINIEELSGNCNNVDSTEPGQIQMPFTVDDNCYLPFQDKFFPLVGDYSSHNQAEEGMMYFDAPSNNSVAEHDYDWTNDFLHTEVPDPSEPDLVDELMTYFDATEDDLLYSMEDRETFDSTNLQSVQFAPEVAVPQTSNIANGLEVFGGYSGSKRENNSVIPDGHSGNGWDKRLKKHLVGMLESISSPPALAAEYPAKEVKYLKLDPTSHSSRSIALAGGVIYMDAWDKFPPYGVSKDAAASDSVEAYGEGRKEEHCGIISMLIRSGFCVSFLSILFLGVSYKLGFCVCSSR